MFKTLKIAAVATAVVLVSASSSFAATFAWVNYDSKVRNSHTTQSMVVNYVEEGQKVKVVNSWGNWYKIQIPGKDGWVKANALDFDNWNGPVNDASASFCINGPNASFCISGNS
jgi:uncharacterized protein YgiM (DUF1202 family)